jgi:HK97 family phage major capsid protein
MWKITTELKKHLQEKFSLAADATDEVVRKMVGEKIASGELSMDDFARLTTAKATEAEQKVQAMIDKSIAPVLDAIKALKPETPAPAAPAAPAESKALNLTAPPAAPATPPASEGQKLYALAGSAVASDLDEPTRIRVKSAIERFDDTRTAATWDKCTSTMVKALGSGNVGSHTSGHYSPSYDMPTERSKAISGVWLKNMAIKRMRSRGVHVADHIQLKEWERDILMYAAHNCKFVGPIGWTGSGDSNEGDALHWYTGEKLMSDLHRKAVLDDSTSGGLEAVPIEFDANVILTPLLNGELFPFVNIVNVGRRRIEATKISNPTMAWGVAEGTAISLFNTDSFISAFDNSIYPITGAMELGLDFLADSPLAVTQTVVQRYGERFRTEMDNVIATGNGTDRPEGVFTTSGVTSVTPSGGAGAAQTVGDYEGLRFGVAKEFRQEAGLRAMYVGTDTSYSRARGIAVGASDQRRVFGIDDQESYTLFQRRYAVNGSLTNAQIGYFCFNRYRMYRRLGLEVRMVTEDWTLARQSKEGIIVRARFGGALELAAAGTKITNGQA